jgi:hypothetical protein
MEKGFPGWESIGNASLRVPVLEGAAALEEAEARVRAVAMQPDDPYPVPSGNFRPLIGRAQI